MARRSEEEENHWPGFVDALSTIVMVVTFLLIILGVAIFAISTQVGKAVADSKAEAKKLEQSQAQMAASITQQADAAKKAEEKAAAALAALENATAAKDAAEAAAKAANEKLAAEPAVPPAGPSDDALEQAHKTIAEQAAELEKQKQAAAELAKQVATLNQATAAAPTQDQAVDADNKLLINSRKLIDPTEISVAAAQEDPTAQSKAVKVESAAAVLVVHFQDRAVQLDEPGQAQAVAFVKANAAALTGHKLTLWSFYDDKALGVTESKRSAYFRVLALRNAMLDAGLKGEDVDMNVRPADTPADVDSVKAFVQ